MDWHLVAFIGTLCVLIFILFLFVTRDNTSEMASTTKSRIRNMHEMTGQPSANLSDYSSIQSLNMPGLGNLAPLGFEAISMLAQSECMETLDSMNAGSPYPTDELDRRFHPVTRGQVPFTSAGDFYTPNETSTIPQNDSEFNSETGEDYYSEQLPPSYEEAMGYRSTTRNRHRRF